MAPVTIRSVQAALIRLGFDLGKSGADGIWGAMSRKAMSAYQRSKGIPETGTIEPVAVARLFPSEVAPPILPLWYQEARRLMGTQEVVGKKHSSVIMGWAKKLGIFYPDDETAWCGLFVAHCMGFTLPNEPQPANQLGARNWMKFGRPLERPALGAVLVFWRDSKAGWSGHVGFYAGERADAFRVLGGNQSNAVTETWIAKNRLLGIRWPTTVDLPTGGPVIVQAGGTLSRNEA